MARLSFASNAARAATASMPSVVAGASPADASSLEADVRHETPEPEAVDPERAPDLGGEVAYEVVRRLAHRPDHQHVGPRRVCAKERAGGVQAVPRTRGFEEADAAG